MGLLRNKWLRLVIPFFLTCLLSLASLACAGQDILIKVDGNLIHLRTLQRHVGAALTEAGISLGPGDLVEPSIEQPVTNGLQVVVHRGFRVIVEADGKKTAVFTHRAPVKKVLDLAGINLNSRDIVNLPLQQMVAKECSIKVTRVNSKTFTENYNIDIPLQRRPDPALERGRTRVLAQGEPGTGQRNIQVTYNDGKEVKRDILSDRVIKPPKERVIAYGVLSTVSRGGENFRFKKMLNVTATAYGPSAGRYTATGHRVTEGMVAVDPKVIPLWSRLYVDGYGFARALDVGSSIKGNRIDVYFASDAVCRRWGVRSVKVYLLE